MKNICLNGLNNTAPTELNKSCVQKFYDDFAPTELIFFAIENQIDQLLYQLYEITEKEIKIVEGK